MKCPDCTFEDETPMIDKFTNDGPFVLRDVWFRHFGSHLGFDDKEANILKHAASLVEHPWVNAAIHEKGLVNEMT